MKNILTAAVLTFVAYVIYPAIIFMVAAGMSGCATEETVAPPPTETVTVYGPEDCTNGREDDGDGLVDCADSNCYDTRWCHAGPFGIQNVHDNGAFYPNDDRSEEPPATTRTDDSFVDALFGSWWFRIPLIITFLFLVGFAFRMMRLLYKSGEACADLERRLEREKMYHHDTQKSWRTCADGNRRRIEALVRIHDDQFEEIMEQHREIGELREQREVAYANIRHLLQLLGVYIN